LQIEDYADLRLEADSEALEAKCEASEANSESA
jgi:hypothetical protein